MPEAGSIRGEADARVSSARPPSPLLRPHRPPGLPPPNLGRTGSRRVHS